MAKKQNKKNKEDKDIFEEKVSFIAMPDCPSALEDNCNNSNDVKNLDNQASDISDDVKNLDNPQTDNAPIVKNLDNNDGDTNKFKNKKRRRQTPEEQKFWAKKLVPVSVIALLAIALLVTLNTLKKNERVAKFMVTKVSRNIVMIMGRLSSALPFSLFELFVYVAIIITVLSIALILFRLVRLKFLRAVKSLLKFVCIVLVLANVYFVSAGFSYVQTAEYFPVYNPTLTKQQLVDITEYFVDDLNQIAADLKRDNEGRAVLPYSSNELSDKMRLEFNRHRGYDISDFTPKCKVIYSSKFMSELHVLGVFFAPFGEVSINGLMPDYEKPFTMAHEIAHAKGVMREDAADQLALYITITSDDPFIRYSGYQNMIFTLLDALSTWESLEGLSGRPEYARLVKKINPLCRVDWDSSNEFYLKHNKWDKLNAIIDALYDEYLKLMGQDEGSNAYVPPDTGTEEIPVIDPDTGGVVIDPDTGKPETEVVVRYTVIQQIFFQAYKESHG